MNPLLSLPARRMLALLLLLGAACLVPADGRQPGGQPDPNPKKAVNAGEPKSEGTLPESVVKSLAWRCVGPANMSGRITAISVYEADPTIYWVATASGGLLKTVNNGVTFEHQFDREEVVSIGDVCVAPSNKDIVWVGTGEANPRNSVSYGNGVYKSSDGGKTWKHMGLKDSFQIGKILVHPKNPDIVYVGALGRLYGPNKERGVYKTTDGGKTWNQVWYKDDKTGVIDMAMHPTDPETLLIAAYERKRDGFDAHIAKEWPDPYDWYDPVVRFGEHAGIYRTSDGGKTFEKITKGLPPGKLGRIGLDWHRADPKIVFAIVDCVDIGKGDAPKKKAGGGRGYAGFAGDDADGGVRVTLVQADSPAAKAGLEINDLVTAVNGKAVKSMEDYRSEVGDLNAGDKITLTVKRDDDTKKLDVTLGESPFKGGGQPKGGNKERPYLAQLGGQAPNAQDEQGPDGWKTGGVYRSEDGGKTWTRVNSLNPRPMYFSVVKVDPTDPKYVYVLGVSQYKSADGGKTFTANAGKGVHADCHAMWINPRDGRHLLIGGDGGFYASYDRASNWDHINTAALGQFYHLAVCNKRPYWLYGGLQDNGSWGLPSVGLKGHGPVNEDVVSIGGGDGFVCRVDPNDPDLVYSESQGGAMSRRNLRTGERAVIRPTVPGGGKGGKGGKGAESPYKFNWNTPFILSHHNSKIFYCAGNFVFKSLDRGDDLKVISPEIPLSKLGTATALSESPKNPDVLWVGTDDGALWITKNGGKDWSEISHQIPMPGPRCVATIEASKYKEGRCYVCFDAHRSNDDQPYIFVTEDFGASWAPIRSDLPGFGSTRCLREDLFNENLLFCGTEFHLYASINRGASWTRINNNLPTVAIHEVAIHPTAGEIAVATHGRSLWVLDVTALRQMKPDTFAKKAHLFKPNTATRWESLVSTGGTNRAFVGTNPAPGAHIYFWLADKGKVEVKVLDVEGDVIAKLTPAGKAGLNKVTWSTFRQMADQPKKGGGGKGGGGGGFQQARVPPGTYRVVLTVDGQELTTTVRVEADPNVPQRGVAEDEESFVDPRKIR